MRKIKTVEPTGKITITQSEERYPYASEILMRHGFFIIFLNMALGLLPVTIWGTRMKYFKCSISQVYTTLFCLCFIILSVIFAPIVFFPKSGEPKGMTNLVILVAMGMLHTFGYICLLIRGQFIAQKIPIVWNQLSKLVQIAVLDVYGKHCYLLKEARSFSRWAVWQYLGIMATTMTSIVAFSLEYSDGIRDSVTTYKLYLYVWPGGEMRNAYEIFQWWCFNIAYFIWNLCASSHVLVSMFLCYMVIVITVCLKSVNQQIIEFKGQVCRDQTKSQRGQGSNSVFVPRVQFSNSKPHRQISLLGSEQILEKLDSIKNVVLIAEEVTQSISFVWGISLIIEALILITAGTVNAYDFLAMFQELKSDGERVIMKFTIPPVDEWLSIFITVSTHFFFLFKLTSRVNKMIQEADRSLHLLKQISSHQLPQAIGDKVNAVKQDLASTSIAISATNFFQVNKFLITSITSQITTYVIVLLQFAQQDAKLNIDVTTHPPTDDMEDTTTEMA